MPNTPFGRPAPGEYFAYFERYISLVPTDDLLGFMRDQAKDVQALFSSITEEKAAYAYAQGKWTIKEVLGHMVDTERVFHYRSLSIARRDPARLPSFDQDVWNPNGGFNQLSLSALLHQWNLVREGNIAFLESLPEDARMRMGVASDNPCSVRALAYISPGHAAYHLLILKERYL